MEPSTIYIYIYIYMYVIIIINYLNYIVFINIINHNNNNFYRSNKKIINVLFSIYACHRFSLFS